MSFIYMLAYRLLCFFIRNYYLFVFIVVHILVFLIQFAFSWSIESYHASLHGSLITYYVPRFEQIITRYDWPAPEERDWDFPPTYLELHRHPTFSPPVTIDLLGKIELMALKLDGLQLLERSLFYNMMDYAVAYVGTTFVVDRVDRLPEPFYCGLIFRTLIEYRDQQWQSSPVHSIHNALELLNDDLRRLLIELYTLDRFRNRLIISNDFNVVTLKHAFVAEASGLEFLDFWWGDYTPNGFAEAREKFTWYAVHQQEKIKAGMEAEYKLYDIDVFMGCIKLEIQENMKMYSRLMKQKFALEAIDLKIAGKKSLSYREIVHYRTYGGDNILFRYGQLKATVIATTYAEETTVFYRNFAAYKRSLNPDSNKSFIDEVTANTERELARKRADYSAHFFHKK